jgi:hypothetical protein
MVYAAVVLATRPVYLHWGTTAAERASSLPGDDIVPLAKYRLDHGITIRAPASAIWPWLMQLGQDRAGFYSYDWLERAFGVDVHNAGTLDPAWADREVGDFVRATQPDYLGGVFGDSLGWRITRLEHERLMYLDKWGAFVLVPVDGHTTRLIVRTRGAGEPSLLSVVLGPVNVFLFEPAHFIMQRGMLRGIRDRAERAAPSLAQSR